MVREVQDLVLRDAGAPGGGQAPPAARRALLAAVHELRRARRGADGAGAEASGARDLATPVVGEVVPAASASASPPGSEPPAGEFPDAALVEARRTVPLGPSSYSLGRPGPPPGVLEAALEEALRRLPGAGDDDGDRLRALDAVLKLQGALASQRTLQLQEVQLQLQARKLGASLERNGLLSEANEVSSRRAEAAEVGLRAQAALENARREDARVVRFCKICADDILSGLLVMLAAVAAGARGRVASRVVFDACERRFWATRAASASSTLLDFLGLSAGEALASFLPLEHLEYAACCAGVLVRLAGSFALLALLAAYLLRRGVASDRWGAPSSALALLLATGCGYVGRLAVAGAGGRGDVWLLLWVALCSVHAALLAGSRTVVRGLAGGEANPAATASGVEVDSLKPAPTDLPLGSLAALRFGTALVIPALVGWLPFCFDPYSRSQW